MTRRAESLTLWLLLLPVLLLLLVMALGLAQLVIRSLQIYAGPGLSAPGLTAENYVLVLTTPFYRVILVRTLRLGLMVAAICVMLGYPMAWYLAAFPSRGAGALLALLVAPLWVSVVVRTYGWAILLGPEGPLNVTLQSMGLGEYALRIYPGPGALIIGLVQICLPLAVFPIYNSLRSIDRRVVEASTVLGALPHQTFRRVVLPLSLPGVFAGALLTFVITVGAYVTPVLLGGPRELTLPLLIDQQVRLAHNFPLAAAFSVAMLLLILMLLLLVRRFLRLDNLFSGP